MIAKDAEAGFAALLHTSKPGNCPKTTKGKSHRSNQGMRAGPHGAMLAIGKQAFRKHHQARREPFDQRVLSGNIPSASKVP
jgi:hypothetical protein